VFVLATSDCYYEAMVAASIEERFSFITEYWRPRVVAELNGQGAKLVKFQGEFPWHHQDEMFLVWHGEMRVEFRDCVVSLRSGEYCVVPRGLEHRTCADEEAAVILFEPAATRNTGNVVDERFTAPDGNPL
jgi:mannose-6-phosphate isomerase-like protein (cupin superfamily)